MNEHTWTFDRIRFTKENYTYMIDLKGAPAETAGLLRMVAERGLIPKSAFHITLVGFRTGRAIKDVLAKLAPVEREVKESAIAQALQETDWAFAIAPEPLLYIEKEFIHPREPQRPERRSSIIQILAMPGMTVFYQKLNSIFATNLEAPPPHITLYTGGTDPEMSKMGIGVDTFAVLESLNPEVIEG